MSNNQHPGTAPAFRFLVRIAFGYQLIVSSPVLDLRAEGRWKVFVFQDRATRRNDVMAFYGDATRVRPLAFAATIKDMKGLLHNG
jgi:hypothetical protein